jgi:hypothetical protein
MKFNLFVQALEKRLGNHHIPINRDAVLLQDLFGNSPVHAEFVTNLIRTIYKKNSCQTLASPITKTITNNTLAESRLSALRANHTDIDTYNFIDDMCLAVDAIFKNVSRENGHKNEGSSSHATTTKISKAGKTSSYEGTSNVVAIEHKRHLRWLKSSA